MTHPGLKPHLAIDIRNEPCSCAPGECAAGLERDEDCVGRLSGDVRTVECAVCGAATWHQDGACLRCRSLKR